MMLEAKEYQIDLLIKEINVYFFLKAFIVVFGENRKDSLLNALNEIKNIFICIEK